MKNKGKGDNLTTSQILATAAVSTVTVLKGQRSNDALLMQLFCLPMTEGPHEPSGGLVTRAEPVRVVP